MTKDHFEALVPFEDDFFRAVKYGYYRSMNGRELQHLCNIYNELTGENIRPLPVCEKCLLEVLKVLGALYYEYKELQAAGHEKVQTTVPEASQEDSEVSDRDAEAENAETGLNGLTAAKKSRKKAAVNG